MLTFDGHLELLTRLQASFLDLARVAEPAAPVPSCGHWTVADLVGHLAEIHHWAAGMARDERAQKPMPPTADRAQQYGEAAAELHTTLAALGPDATSRILDGITPDGRGPASFWACRQVHETLIHLHDLAAAAGRAPAAQPPTVWADAVDEVVTVMYPRQIALGRTTPVHPAVTLVADDAGARWLLGEGTPVARVTGAARSLALLLWKRRELPGPGPALEVTGDFTAVTSALGRPLVP